MKNKSRLRYYAERVLALWGDEPGSVDWTEYNEQDCEAITNLFVECWDEAIEEAAQAAVGISKQEHVQQSILAQLKGKHCLVCDIPSGLDALCDKHSKPDPKSGAW